MRRLAALALLFLVLTPVCAETINVTGGSSTLDLNNGVKGSVWQVTGAQISVSTTETVNANITAVVTYQVGVVMGGQFMQVASYTRNLTAGANQAVSNTFTALSQNVAYTVKCKTTYSDTSVATHTDVTVTVKP